MFQVIMLGRAFIYIFLLALFLKCNAQQDSSVISVDTVILLKEPFIVRKAVILGDGAGGSFSKSKSSKVLSSIKEKKWSLVLGFSTGSAELKTPGTLQKLKVSDNSQSYLSLFLHHHNFQFGIGAGFVTTDLHYSNYTPESRSKQEIITVYDYSNASTIILPGRIIFEGVVSRDSITTIHYSVLEESRKKARLQYLRVPLNAAFRFNLENKKWFVLPQLELAPNILVSKPTENTIDMPKAFFWMYGMKCSVGYDLTEKFSILASIQMQNSLGGIYADLHPSLLTFTGYGFALSYKLN